VTLVDAETGEIVTGLTPDAAREVTDRIKVGVEAVWHLIAQAYEGRAWAALGYSSWDDYCTREFGTSRLRLPREERQEVVASLRESGLSTRAIAAATGYNDKTVRNDLAAGAENSAPGDEVEDAEIVDDEPPAPQPVTGTDGKRYQPKPAVKPQRSPLALDAERAGWQFRKAVERLEALVEDDRFSANKQQVAAHLSGHLSYAIEVCQDLMTKLETTQ